MSHGVVSCRARALFSGRSREQEQDLSISHPAIQPSSHPFMSRVEGEEKAPSTKVEGMEPHRSIITGVVCGLSGFISFGALHHICTTALRPLPCTPAPVGRRPGGLASKDGAPPVPRGGADRMPPHSVMPTSSVLNMKVCVGH